ncbi:MAG: 5'/3'-nucleotidase SurE [Propionicimonas sp.]|uniref:5'/3'-nucleotidase SurE n=1 Tax=Propionicimonas sp. TaxID=1955623 RepID=UPI003D145280
MAAAAALTAALTLGLVGATAPAQAAKVAPGISGLRILLTNDDSMQAAKASNSDGLGLYELRKQLCARGADVVVIAPWSVQSGKGSAVTNSGSFRLGQTALPAGYESDCASAPAKGAVYGVCTGTDACSSTSGSATPADTVMFATRGGLAATVGWSSPDLIVSGTNAGSNYANSVNDSGTVGAAITANTVRIPAVAFSSSNASDWSMPVANYQATAKWGADFLAALNNKGLLLQNKFVLNVNYPDVSAGAPARRAKWARVGDSTAWAHTYVPQSDGSYAIEFELCTGMKICTEHRKDSDWLLLNKGHITVVPLSWDRTYGVTEGGRTYQRVKSFVEHYKATA